jgi:hypothetical protein
MKRILLGTDWWTDCDDAVAIRLLANAVRRGEAELLGIGINAAMPHSVASLRGFLAHSGLSVPLGLDREATDFGGSPSYQARLAKTLCPQSSNDEAEDAVHLYRRILANATSPLEMVEIGYLQVAAGLLLSEGDDVSPKSGMELVKEKVIHFWVMAGKWDEDGGLENNFCRNGRSRRAAEVFCRLCPVPVTFLGWEVGNTVLSGMGLPEEDPLCHVLRDHGSPNGRSSWDPMLVLMAIIGDEEKAGYDTVSGKASLEIDTGKNHFAPDPNGLHKYVIKKFDDSYYADMINDLIK